jgi:phosphatidylethanolamine/phosphatidyl-N-methylethanolamine N-methyltransferase
VVKEFNNYYGGQYSRNHYTGILGLFTNNYHLQLERSHNPLTKFEKVLEIGGGTGEHLRYVKHGFELYTIVDNSEIAEDNLVIPSHIPSQNVKFILGDASNLPLESNQYDRVIVTCVLHHIPNLELAALEIRRVAKRGAVLDFYVPCDPGLVYRWARHWTSHLKQKKLMGLSWTEVKYLWATEHRNHYLGIMFTIKEVFADDKVVIQRFPVPLFSWNFNLYSIVRIRVSKI